MSGTSSPPTAAGTIGGPGLFEVEQESATIVFQRLLHHPIEEVWSAITDPKQIGIWFMAKVTRPSNSGTLEMGHISGVHATGRVLEWRPPRVYEYEWNVAAGSALPNGETSIVRWELSSTPEGTLLILTHRKLTLATGKIFAGGLKVFLDRLAAMLDGTPLPEPSWLADAPPPES